MNLVIRLDTASNTFLIIVRQSAPTSNASCEFKVSIQDDDDDDD